MKNLKIRMKPHPLVEGEVPLVEGEVQVVQVAQIKKMTKMKKRKKDFNLESLQL